jgi:hypothetical protein
MSWDVEIIHIRMGSRWPDQSQGRNASPTILGHILDKLPARDFL